MIEQTYLANPIIEDIEERTHWLSKQRRLIIGTGQEMPMVRYGFNQVLVRLLFAESGWREREMKRRCPGSARGSAPAVDQTRCAEDVHTPPVTHH